MNDISNTIASAVEEQTATTNEIARNVQEGAKGGAQVAENIVAVAQAAKSTTQGANDTQTAAGELARMAAELQKVVSRFRFDDGAETRRGCRNPVRPRNRFAMRIWRAEPRRSLARPYASTKQRRAVKAAPSLAKMAADRRKLAGKFKC